MFPPSDLKVGDRVDIQGQRLGVASVVAVNYVDVEGRDGTIYRVTSSRKGWGRHRTLLCVSRLEPVA